MNSFRHLSRISQYLDLCSACGLCVSICPAHKLAGNAVNSPRAYVALLQAWLRGYLGDGEIAPVLGNCILCGRCQKACPSHLPLPDLFRAAREDLALSEPLSGKFLARPLLSRPKLTHFLLKTGINVYNAGCATGIIKKARLNAPFNSTDRKLRKGNIMVFAGCLPGKASPQITQSAAKILDSLDIAWQMPEFSCCGAYETSQGRNGNVRKMIRRNLKILREYSPETLVSLCPHCLAQIRQIWPRLPGLEDADRACAEHYAKNSTDIASFLATRSELQNEVEMEERLRWHKPCGMDDAEEQAVLGLLFNAGKQIISRTDSCCGNMCASKKHPLFEKSLPPEKKSKKDDIQIADRRVLVRDILRHGLAASASTLITGCPGCLTRMQKASEEGIKIRHWLEIYADSLASVKDN